MEDSKGNIYQGVANNFISHDPVAACGKAHDTNLIGVDQPFGGMVAKGANGVFIFFGSIPRWRSAVFLARCTRC